MLQFEQMCITLVFKRFVSVEVKIRLTAAKLFGAFGTFSRCSKPHMSVMVEVVNLYFDFRIKSAVAISVFVRFRRIELAFSYEYLAIERRE